MACIGIPKRSITVKLADIMVKDVITITPDDNSATAAKRMREKDVGCLVVAIDRAIKGIVTDRDLLSCLSEGHDPHQCRVSVHMSRPVIIERPEEELLVAAEVMGKRRIKRLPVVEHGQLVGLVSFSDISRLMDEQAKAFWTTWMSMIRLIEPQARHCRTGGHSSTPFC